MNPVDTKIRSRGLFFPGAQPPAVLGCDGAGEVVAVGSGVTRFRVGDAVWFCNGGLGREQGNYAQYTVVDESVAQAKPVAIQLARLWGARVATTVSTTEKADLVRRLGAELVIDYRSEDFVAAVSAWTDGRGVDVVLDTVGPAVFQASVPAVAHYGRLVTLLLLDPGAGIDWKEARLRNLNVSLVLMLTPMLRDLPDARAAQGDVLRTCSEWFDRGELRVQLADTLPLERAADAHALIEAGHVQGKLVLTVD